MCIIAIKHAGTPVNWELLDNCEDRNPDGAGYAILVEDKVLIRKGFFKNSDMKISFEDEKLDEETLTKSTIMFHYRIATHGKVAPATCHPFPITDSIAELEQTSVDTDIAVAHNGMIDRMPDHKYLSDTMQYIRYYLAPLGDAIHSEGARNVVEHSVDGKLAIMIDDVENPIYLMGNFLTPKQHKGWIFSNDSYKGYSARTYTQSHPFIYDDSYYDDYFSFDDGGKLSLHAVDTDDNLTIKDSLDDGICDYCLTENAVSDEYLVDYRLCLACKQHINEESEIA